MKKRIFIETGHDIDTKTNKVSGAIFKNLNEARMVRELGLAVYDYLSTFPDIADNIVLDQAEWALKDTLKHFKKKIKKDDIALSLHFNAFSKQSANGTEAFIPTKSTLAETSLASSILRGMAKLGFRNRGMKTEAQSQHTRLGWLHLNAEAVLFEVAFISSNKDMLLYKEKYPQVIALIGDALVSAYREECKK